MNLNFDPGEKLKRRARRQRIAEKMREENEAEEKSSTIEKVVRKLDFHPKTPDLVQEKSVSGAFVSIFFIFVMLFILWEESNVAFNPVAEDVWVVDTNVTEVMRINIDITFLKMSCSEVMIDCVDQNGEQQIAVEHDLVKTSVKSDGTPVMYAKQKELGSVGAEVFQPEGYCGSCYGAGYIGECCNSCAQLREVYRRYGRAVHLADTAPQCMEEGKYTKVVGEEGCRVIGVLKVSKLKGNFHVAAGSAHAQQHMDHAHHVHHVDKSKLPDFDISHVIHHLSFGDDYPGQIHPLDGSYYPNKGVGQLKYMIQLVPTVYHGLDGKDYFTHQFSVTDFWEISEYQQQHYKLPGVFFNYDFAPLRISYKEKQKSLREFITRLCAVIGGSYVVLGLCSSIWGLLMDKITGSRRQDKQ